MSNIEIPWEISGGQITATASVTGLIKVLESKTTEHSGTFWTWENKVNLTPCLAVQNNLNAYSFAGIPMVICTGVV